MITQNTLKIIYTKRCFLISKNAEPSPPLGTILGNLGVNTIKFCEEFNKFTHNLPSYFYVKVQINIFENRTFSFCVELPSTSYFLNILKFEKIMKFKLFNKIIEKNVNCIKLNTIVKLSIFKFPSKNIKESIFLIFGCLKSMNIILII